MDPWGGPPEQCVHLSSSSSWPRMQVLIPPEARQRHAEHISRLIRVGKSKAMCLCAVMTTPPPPPPPFLPDSMLRSCDCDLNNHCFSFIDCVAAGSSLEVSMCKKSGEIIKVKISLSEGKVHGVGNLCGFFSFLSPPSHCWERGQLTP